jgi:cystathionine beta-lyase/cystathionine gamma-synthase
VTCTFVDGRDSEEFERAIQPNTRLIYLESPTTFTFKLQNLKEVADIAHRHHIKTVIENTWATPFFRIPSTMASIWWSTAVPSTSEAIPTSFPA